MRRTLISLQVFALMCSPLPQASYAAVGLGRTLGMRLLPMVLLYALSDLVVFLAYWWVTRRLGFAGLGRIQRRLPSMLGERLARAGSGAERVGQGTATLPAIFAAGSASLYLAVVMTALSRARLLPAMLAAVTADVLQFTGTVALAGALARLLPVPGGQWLMLAAAPALVALLPLCMRMGRAGARHINLRPAPLPGAAVAHVPAGAPA